MWLASMLGSAPGLCTPVLAQSFDQARDAIQRHMAESNVPGLAVAVWKDGKVLWEEGFGWADVENRVAATEHTTFNLASLSKTLTAVGVMTLVEAGKVDLDRAANDYLGPDKMRSYAGDPAAATVRSLLNHTSGLVGSAQYFYGRDQWMLPSISATIQRYGILTAPVGERYRYSNIGYGVLGHLIAQVSRRKYEDYLRTEIFLPLGMTHSSMNAAAGLERHQAVRYDYDRRPIPFYVSAEPGSVSIYSSAHDLARFGLYFLKRPLPGQRKILSEQSIERMMRDAIRIGESPARAAQPGESGYALGWAWGEAGGFSTVGHSGSTSGVSTILLQVPSENLGVAVLANADGGVGRVHEALLKSVLPSWREKPPVAARNPEAPFAPTAQLIGAWRGQVHTFEGLQPIQLDVQVSGDVHVQIGEPGRANRSNVRQKALLNDVAFSNGQLTGRTLAQVETADTKRHPHTTSLFLTLRGDVLEGYASANSVFDQLWIYELPHWARLQKQVVASTP